LDELGAIASQSLDTRTRLLIYRQARISVNAGQLRQFARHRPAR